MLIPIEKDVPLPEKTRTTARKYPFKEMEIGDSFFVPDKKLNAFSGYLGLLRKKHGKVFTSRIVGSGARIWRIA